MHELRTGVISSDREDSMVFLECEIADLERRGGKEEHGGSETARNVDANLSVRQSYSEKTLSMG